MRNNLIVLQLNTKNDLRALREPVDRTAWIGSVPTVVNAFYNPSFNAICKRVSLRELPVISLFLFSFSGWHSSDAPLRQRCTQVREFARAFENVFIFVLGISTTAVRFDSM